MLRLLFMLLVAGATAYECTRDIELPTLLIGGLTQAELLARLDALEGRGWCPPPGTVIFTEGTCPAGFDDVTSEYAGRYVAVGTPGVIGTAADLATHTAAVGGIMFSNKPGPTDTFSPASLAMGPGPATVASADVAPAVLLRACRAGAC